MSAGLIGKVTNHPDDLTGTAMIDERQSTWGTIPGQIVSFDPQKQTATIKPLYRPKHNGKAVDMPDLLEVPVRFPRGGAGAITHPLKKDDYVELRPIMRSSENWHLKSDGEASDSRSFSLSDMEAYVVGGESLKNPIKNFDPANHHFRLDEDGNFGLKGSPDGKLALIGNQGNAYTLVADAVKEAGDGFTLLGTEALVHAGEYAQIGSRLLAIEAKLRGMSL